MTPPLFAIIGHPNEGKSSVVSTLTENDSIAISSTPGETTRSNTYDAKAQGKTIISFVDTPGFQNPTRCLSWLKENELSGAAAAKEFINRFSADSQFHHDCELMTPLAQGAGVIFVADASRPLSKVDLQEMEILRLLGLPRAAIINSKSESQQNLEQWKDAFRKNFNAIRVFNAHNANFTERIGLLETLKTIEQDWSPALVAAIQAINEDWGERAQRSAEIISGLLEESLVFTQSKLIANESQSASSQKKLKESYREGLIKLEKRAWADMKNLYRHHKLSIDFDQQSILNEDLFSEKTWQAMGLTQSQLAIAASTIGAGIGLSVDAALSGLSFGVFTAAGALFGGGAALLKGQELSKMKVNHVPLGGLKLTIGPNRNEQFPFILLDRALLFHRVASNWAHAKQENTLEIDSNKKKGDSSNWSDKDRKLAARFFAAIKSQRQDKLTQLYPEFNQLITNVL
ncbi:GTPase/DUF3482 domain-containing protein [Puniceicoccaceae bacterium K14]|nr:GTPase/DUF3482 domain-containing protein [Puniceicoccaceae bacterium K14]